MDTLGSNFSPSLKDVTNLYATEFVDIVPGVSPPESFETITFKGAGEDVRFDDLPLCNSANFFCCEGKGNFVVAVYEGANGVLEGKFLDDPPTRQDAWLELDKWLHRGDYKFRELRSMSRSLYPHVM